MTRKRKRKKGKKKKEKGKKATFCSTLFFQDAAARLY